MGEIVDLVTDLNYWSSNLPIYAQVFLGMLAFFTTCTIAGLFMYGLLLMSQRIRLLSSFTGALGYVITLCLGWLLYIFIPLMVIALGHHEQININLLTQTIVPYFGIFFLLSLSLIDTLEANGNWRHKKLPLPAQLFTSGIWLLALGVPAISHFSKPTLRC
jgi:hypothetical protein